MGFLSFVYSCFRSDFSTKTKKHVAIGSTQLMEMEAKHGAHNYHPVPIVFSRAEGAKVWDPEGNEYLDFLSAYSAVNQGHCHPRILEALRQQSLRLTISSRAFHNDRFGLFAKFITELFQYDMVLPMNTGAEGVETALKLARKWGYLKKGIPENKAIILACKGNFHGRTLGIISMSSDPTAKKDFGPFLPRVGYHISGIDESNSMESDILIRYGHIEDLRNALDKYGSLISAFLVEPIQGEAGVILPPDGYLKECYELCKQHNVLFIADEIQTGLGRCGKLLAVEYENVRPDILILGKALGGGVYPVSVVLANKNIMECIQPGEHGSTFGGNPIACAVAQEALQVIIDEDLAEKSERLGKLFRNAINQFNSPIITDIRGKGLLNAIELDESKMQGRTAWHLCLLLKSKGILAKQTHGNIIRFSPPLVIQEKDLKKGLEIIDESLKEILTYPIA
jgi:ornithine--oxo-acid transaminase